LDVSAARIEKTASADGVSPFALVIGSEAGSEQSSRLFALPGLLQKTAGAVARNSAVEDMMPCELLRAIRKRERVTP
jgi:hypothetical protein